MLIDLAFALGWIALSLALVFGVPALVRRLVPPPPRAEDEAPPTDGHVYPTAIREGAQVIGLRVAALYGVILALVYAHELANYESIRDGMAREAVAVADVYHDGGRLAGPTGALVKEAMQDYVAYVVEREWRLLATERRLSQRAWNARDRAYEALLDLEPASAREATLRDRMIRRLHDIGEFRHLRQELAAADFGLAFWIPALVGLGLVALPLFIFPPTRAQRILGAALAVFAGMILYFVQAFANPFGYPLRDEPAPFQRLLDSRFEAAEPLVPPVAP
jgi:hypothetical protein